MKKHLVLILALLTLLWVCAIVVSAHSGRTDENGGHSGTVKYHYHHGKPAHQHPNGVCPYERTEEDIQRDFGIVLSVIVGFPVVVVIILKILLVRMDAKKRSTAIIPDFMVWYSPTGACYHSSKSCTVLRNSKNIRWATDRTNTPSIYDKKPCSICCCMKEGKVYPKEPEEQESALPSMVSVVSSNLKEVGYRQGSLYVHFHNGDTCRYDNVPQSLAERLMTSPSAGKFFNKRIRDHYHCERIPTP